MNEPSREELLAQLAQERERAERFREGWLSRGRDLNEQRARAERAEENATEYDKRLLDRAESAEAALSEVEKERDELLCTASGKLPEPMAKAHGERINERFKELHQRIEDATSPRVESLESLLGELREAGRTVQEQMLGGSQDEIEGALAELFSLSTLDTSTLTSEDTK